MRRITSLDFYISCSVPPRPCPVNVPYRVINFPLFLFCKLTSLALILRWKILAMLHLREPDLLRQKSPREEVSKHNSSWCRGGSLAAARQPLQSLPSICFHNRQTAPGDVVAKDSSLAQEWLTSRTNVSHCVLLRSLPSASQNHRFPRAPLAPPPKLWGLWATLNDL